MKIAITGGRAYLLQPEDHNFLANQITKIMAGQFRSDATWLHGDATGVDREVARILDHQGLLVKGFPADWEEHGLAAGFIRNRQMAQECDLLLAFPGGNGTEHMIKTCLKLGKEVRYSPTRKQPDWRKS